MAKDAYYFPHDSNAKDDPKCIMLIEELGLEGYGIFWVLIETLRDQPQYKAPMSMLPALGRRYNSSGEKFRAVVSRYGLFSIDNDEFFYSEPFSRRMGAIDLKRKELSDAGKRGNAIRWQSGGESGGDGVAIAIKGKESKSEEMRGNQSKDVASPQNSQLGIYERIETATDYSQLIPIWTEYRKTKGQYPTLYEIDVLQNAWAKKEISALKSEMLKAIENGWKSLVEQKTKNASATPYLDTLDNKPF
jgi:hypothetical protein